MGGGSGSAYETKRGLGKAGSRRAVVGADCDVGTCYYFGLSNLPLWEVFLIASLRILFFFGFHVVMSVLWGCI